MNTTYDQDFNGQWFNAEQNGHGIQVEEVDNNGVPHVNMSWYVYHEGKPVWLVGVGSIIGNSAEISMAITSGPDFGSAYNPDDLNVFPWGTVKLTLTGKDSLQLDWDSTDATFGSGSMMMERLSAIKGMTPFAFGINSYHSGSWYNPAQNGHGFMTQVVRNDNKDVLILTWYTYHNGEQIWLTASGLVEGAKAKLQAVTAEGALFPPWFNPDDVNLQIWGDITFELINNDQAKISWQPQVSGYEAGELVVERLTFIDRYRCH